MCLKSIVEKLVIFTQKQVWCIHYNWCLLSFEQYKCKLRKIHAKSQLRRWRNVEKSDEQETQSYENAINSLNSGHKEDGLTNVVSARITHIRKRTSHNILSETVFKKYVFSPMRTLSTNRIFSWNDSIKTTEQGNSFRGMLAETHDYVFEPDFWLRIAAKSEPNWYLIEHLLQRCLIKPNSIIFSKKGLGIIRSPLIT